MIALSWSFGHMIFAKQMADQMNVRWALLPLWSHSWHKNGSPIPTLSLLCCHQESNLNPLDLSFFMYKIMRWTQRIDRGSCSNDHFLRINYGKNGFIISLWAHSLSFLHGQSVKVRYSKIKWGSKSLIRNV